MSSLSFVVNEMTFGVVFDILKLSFTWSLGEIASAPPRSCSLIHIGQRPRRHDRKLTNISYDSLSRAASLISTHVCCLTWLLSGSLQARLFLALVTCNQ